MTVLSYNQSNVISSDVRIQIRIQSSGTDTNLWLEGGGFKKQDI